MLTDIEIAQKASLSPIRDIAHTLGIQEDNIELYGKYKAKLNLQLIDEKRIAQSHLILVTAMTPSPPGEGKTTVSIGISDGLTALGKKTIVALREPSLGPVFGLKGGATGGGYSQVVPMEDINLHFTGDFAAIEKANNLLAAIIDNELYSNHKKLYIDSKTIVWKRAMDINDRSLRHIIVGVGNKSNGILREAGFNITAASEVMAILCLSKDFKDLKKRLDNIFIGYTLDKKPLFAKNFKAGEAMAILLKDAIKPNLVQTLGGTPAILHGGPFANIAQGTNSIIATKMAMSLADCVVTEAGFGADLGAEKFLNIKCPIANIHPHAMVLVVTIRALRYHGGASSTSYHIPDIEKIKIGFTNVEKHIENCMIYGYTPIIAINYFPTDSEEEIQWVKNQCAKRYTQAVVSYGWSKGGEGCMALAQAILESIQSNKNHYKPLYNWQLPIKEKIERIATAIYGASQVIYSEKANSQLKTYQALGIDSFPICMAKTQKSFSDDEKKLARPTHFNITIREFELAMGAGFIIPIVGQIMRMPGLPHEPASDHMYIHDDGNTIIGLS